MAAESYRKTFDLQDFITIFLLKTNFFAWNALISYAIIYIQILIWDRMQKSLHDVS